MKFALIVCLLPSVGVGFRVAKQGTYPEIQGNKTYAADYIKDDNSAAVDKSIETAGGKSASGSDSSDSHVHHFSGGGHSPEWYKEKCTEITERCEGQIKDILSIEDDKIGALEEEVKRREKILDGRTRDHDEAEVDVKDQKKEVADAKEEVKKSEKVVKEKADCPSDLAKARSELQELEATPNETPEDIDAECAKKKEILKKESCVEELEKAEDVLVRHEGKHGDEKDDLHSERDERDAAEKVLPPSKEKLADAKRRLDDAKAHGSSDKIKRVKAQCEAEKDALKKQADDAVKAAEEEYERQKRILDGHKDDHKEAKDDVKEQKKEVKKVKEKVVDAKEDVEDKSHCPSELEKAKEELAKLEAIPNQTPEDVDAECKLKKEILKKQECVRQLHDATDVLDHHKDDHHENKDDLSDDKHTANNAKLGVDLQDETVQDAKRALDEAKAARDALDDCAQGGESRSHKSAKSGAAKSNIVSMFTVLAALHGIAVLV